MHWFFDPPDDLFMMLQREGRMYEVRLVAATLDDFTFLGVNYLEQVKSGVFYETVLLRRHIHPSTVQPVHDGKGGIRYQVRDDGYPIELTPEEMMKARARYLAMKERMRVAVTTEGCDWTTKRNILKTWFRGKQPEPLSFPFLEPKPIPLPPVFSAGEQLVLDIIRDGGGFVVRYEDMLGYIELETGRMVGISFDLQSVSSLVRQKFVIHKQHRAQSRYYDAKKLEQERCGQ